MPQSNKQKKIHALLDKGSLVKIKSGKHQGETGEVKKITDDEGKRFLQIKIERLDKQVEENSDDVTLISEPDLKREFDTIEDIGEDEGFILVQDSQDIDELKHSIPDPSAKDYDGFFVKVGDGEITEVYGFEGSVPRLDAPVARLETEHDRKKRIK